MARSTSVRWALLVGLCFYACSGETENLGQKTPSGTGGQAGGSGDAGVAIGGATYDAALDATLTDSLVESDVPAESDAPVESEAGCPLDTTDYVTQITTGYCQANANCCDSQGLGYDIPACVTQLKPFMQHKADRALCKGGTWDPARVTACVSGLEQIDCPQTSSKFGPLWSQVCLESIVGPENPGVPCEDPLECFADAGHLASCANSVCKVSTLVGVGQACDMFAAAPKVCDDTQKVLCIGGVCVPPKPEGGSCDPNYTDCLEGLACPAGACTPYGKMGDACGPVAPCDWTLKCFAGTCGGGSGVSCSSSDECGYAFVCKFGKCIVDMTAATMPGCLAPN